LRRSLRDPTVRAMASWYEDWMRPLWFRMDPELAHGVAATGLRLLGQLGPVTAMLRRRRQAAGEPVEVMGLRFPNAVGLAAGFDKNGELWGGAAALGFGHVEIGTVTPQRQPGNDRPRLFRHPPARAVINRMGFNNDGVEAVAARLRAAGAMRKRPLILGANLGKGRTTPLDRAVEDYVHGFQALADYVDYVTLNVSSPNTPDLRRLQEQTRLEEILGAVQEANRARAKKLGRKPWPVLVKIAPDLDFRQIDAVLEVALDKGLAGIVATNTTIARPADWDGPRETGGLSGAPLHDRAVEIVRYLARAAAGRLVIVGAGGVDSAGTAARMLDNGAALVQLYTGLVFRGPGMVTEVARALGSRRRDWV